MLHEQKQGQFQVTDSSCHQKFIHFIFMFCLFFHSCENLEILYRQALPSYLAAESHLFLHESLPGHMSEHQLSDRRQFPVELLVRQEKNN